MEVIIKTLIEMLDCSEEEAEMIAEEIMNNLAKESLIITTSF